METKNEVTEVTHADVAEHAFEIETDAIVIAKSLITLALKMEAKGYNADPVITALTHVSAMGIALNVVGELALHSKS